jgi:hypothetical protein
MKIQQSKPLSKAYSREEQFSADLANHIEHLNVGSFEDAEIESTVGTRRADIVATGNDGVLVIENQFGKADWDHWGRLEAYARLKEANVAALVAESFEELMIVTCSLRNEDSKIDWYLIKAELSGHDELSFHHVSRPAIDIQAQRNKIEFSEFWAPIRVSGLFAGKPVPATGGSEWISKSIRGIELTLQIHKKSCSVVVYFYGDNRIDRRNRIVDLFADSEFEFEIGESTKSAKIVFPVSDKGKNDRDDWDEIRRGLVSLGESVFTRVMESDV